MAKVEVTMPKMGESITEGTVIVWHKQPGDEVEQDETLLEIGTDKVDTEVPSPASGVLQEILVEEGDTVEVGTVIANLETDADAAAASNGAASDEGEQAQEASQEEDTEVHEMEAETQPSGGGAAVDVVMPKMGESITEGTVIVWHKEVGDEVEQDETLLEIGTDKVDTEVPSPESGVLTEILVEEGETVEVGTVIARLGSEAGAAPAAKPSEPAPQQKSGAPAQEERAPQPAGGGDISRHGSEGQFFSPLVRSIAEKEGLSMQELESIEGSGREGRVSKEDVLSYLENRGEQAAQPARQQAPSRQVVQPSQPTRPPASTGGTEGYDGRVEIVEMDRIRQMIADHMIRSKQTSAHVTSFTEADVTNLVKLRNGKKQEFFEREGVKLTFTPFFVKAAVEALREHEVLNASVDGNKVIIKKDFNIGIAVAIGKTGLVVPVIRNAGHKNITGLAHSAADLADRARSKRLQPDDLQGGTFTVTNIGSLGSLMGTPIINQPQVGIMATGAIKKRPVVIEDEKLGDVITVRHMMNISLSYDHRIIDGAMAASFLHHFVKEVEAYQPGDEI